MKLLSAVLVIPAFIIAGVFALIFISSSTGCADVGIRVNADKLPSSIGAFSSDQVANAATIVNAGANLGVTIEAQTVALMVAITESDLRNLDDAHSSNGRLGLFQQADETRWGTSNDRLTPTTASMHFYQALKAVTDWESMVPTLAANAVQGSAEPYQYEASAKEASAILAAFGAENSNCKAGPAGEVNSQGWASPIDGRVGSPYGPRDALCTNGYCTGGFHNGQDFEAPAGTPIYAIRGGTVSAAGPNASFGNWIVIDHGSGISSVYSHMYGDGVFVRTGDRVSAGQNIGTVGCSGVCTGPHLHIEIRINGERIDPMPFLERVGLRWN